MLTRTSANICGKALTIGWIAIGLAGCSGDSSDEGKADGSKAMDDDARPEELREFDASRFSNPTQIDNPYLPFEVGVVRVYFENSEDGVEAIVVEVLDETREVFGVEARVVRDRVFLDGLLIEDTYDWYSQDDDGNVWYLGEDVTNYEYDDDDEIESRDHDGAWEAGEDGALPGIVMLAEPEVGDVYYQEYLKGEAEDQGEVEEFDVDIELQDGSEYTTLKTKDTNPLDDEVEFKFYAKNVGVVREESEDGEEVMELLATFRPGPDSVPEFDAEKFSDPTTVDNEYFPLKPGSTWNYEAETEDGTESIKIAVLEETKMVNGIACVVVRDTVELDGALVEDTHDWYAQDDDGNVWYMGEAVDNYEDGELVDHDGSWEAGTDDALPGYLMKASPKVGDSYHQEWLEGEADDMGFVVATGISVELPDGTKYEDCLQTFDWVPLEPEALEYKFYAPGVGVVKELSITDEEATFILPE